MNKGKELLLGQVGVSGGETADLGNVHGSPSATDSASEDCLLLCSSSEGWSCLSSNSLRGRRLRNYEWRHSHVEETQTLSLEFPSPDEKISPEICTCSYKG